MEVGHRDGTNELWGQATFEKGIIYLTPENKIRVGSLFSGIGGLDLGLERAGMQVIWQVEKDPYCQKVLKKHWPEVPCYGDIKEIDFTTLPAVDLICGGFPCQPVSCAGKRQGDKDEMWLWPEFYRAVCEAGPRWVLVENVVGLLSAADGRLFGRILGALADGGYDAEWRVVPSGALREHKRNRLFLLAYANGKRSGNSSKRFSPLRMFSGVLPEALRERPSEPPILGVVNDVPSRVDRLKCLGNAVVPQVVEWIGNRIRESFCLPKTENRKPETGS